MLVFIMRVAHVMNVANDAIYKVLKNDVIFDFIDFFIIKIDEIALKISKKELTRI